MLPNFAELQEFFTRVLGTRWVYVTVHDSGAVTVRAREVESLDEKMLADIEANGFRIEQWSFEIGGAGTFIAHLRKVVSDA